MEPLFSFILRKIQHTRMCRATVCGAVCTGYAKALRGGEGTGKSVRIPPTLLLLAALLAHV
jgi:hypothetical protein